MWGSDWDLRLCKFYKEPHKWRIYYWWVSSEQRKMCKYQHLSRSYSYSSKANKWKRQDMLLECRNHRFILMIGTSKSYSSKNMVHIFSELHLSQKNQYNYYKTFSGSNNHTSGRSNDICCIVHLKCNIQVSKFYKRSYHPMNKVHNT